MVTIKFIYSTDVNLDVLHELLSSLSEVRKFKLERLDINSSIKKESLSAKKILVKYGTNQVPFLLFINSKGEEYGAIYNEHEDFTREKINNLIRRGYEKNLPL